MYGISLLVLRSGRGHPNESHPPSCRAPLRADDTPRRVTTRKTVTKTVIWCKRDREIGRSFGNFTNILAKTTRR